MTSASFDNAIARARAASVEPDAERRWELLSEIQLPPEDQAAVVSELLASPALSDRHAATSLLNQLASSGDPVREAVAARLWPAAIGSIDEPALLEDLLTAVGHLQADDLRSRVLAYAEHPDAGVRDSVAFALAGLSGDVPDEMLAVLYALARDEDDEVRDWAIFALGRGRRDRPTDTPEAVAIFRAAAGDEDAEIAMEGRAALEALGLDV